MPASDPLDILLRHNQWGTHQVLDACEPLSNEEFHQRLAIGPGSLHDTLTHIIGAMRSWGDVLAEREIRSRPEGESHSIAELRVMLDEATADLTKSAAAHPNDEVLTRERGGREYSFTRGAVLTHVTTHGVHHRAQCLNMLRQLSREELPPLSAIEWSVLSSA